MIQLGCNYSQELIEIITKEKVEVSWIKLANEVLYDTQFEAIKSIRPGLFHIVPYVLSNQYHKDWNLERLNKAIRECKSPHVGVHLRANKNDIKGVITREVLKQKTLAKIREGKRDIKSTYLVENMPITCLPEDYKTLADPKFIKEICEEAGIGLLLDVSHLKISAWYRGESEKSYLNKLPLSLVKEIHINGPRLIENEYYDSHLEMREEDYTFLEEVLSLTQPSIVTLEYGGPRNDNIETDINLLQTQLEKLSSIIKK
ncbi:DUF692 family multinuclear iron-containing protein [Abyssisolibacter fermentans]|uniref:multinuclear nonheme iron-dependent oxidase n=1 Tax=Abyssisolibacter fermentans TaxID=1766203 RepID=UPI00082CCFA6|nr:DUF692 family multinuclear iron-containing protein [Abyssisolibacter fermentans]